MNFGQIMGTLSEVTAQCHMNVVMKSSQTIYTILVKIDICHAIIYDKHIVSCKTSEYLLQIYMYT